MSYVRNYLLTLFLLTFFVAPMYGLLYMLPFFFTWKYFPLIPGKVNAVLQHNLTPIFCCGETLEIREANTHIELIGKQIRESLFHLDKETIAK